MIYKVVFKRLGAHTHVRLWSGEEIGSLGLAGRLVFLNEEWDRFREILCGGDTRDQVFFEEQTISGLATRENNGFHPA